MTIPRTMKKKFKARKIWNLSSTASPINPWCPKIKSNSARNIWRPSSSFSKISVKLGWTLSQWCSTYRSWGVLRLKPCATRVIIKILAKFILYSQANVKFTKLEMNLKLTMTMASKSTWVNLVLLGIWIKHKLTSLAWNTSRSYLFKKIMLMPQLQLRGPHWSKSLKGTKVDWWTILS